MLGFQVKPVEYNFPYSPVQFDLEPHFGEPEVDIDDFYSDEDFLSLSPYDWKDTFSIMTDEIRHDGIVSPETSRDPQHAFNPQPLQLRRQKRVVPEKTNDRSPLSIPQQPEQAPRSAPPSVMTFQHEHRHTWDSPVSPDHHPEHSTPPVSHFSRESRRDTFIDAADVGLFVQAMTGLDGNMPSMLPDEPPQNSRPTTTQDRLEIPFLQPQGVPTETRSAPHTPNIHILSSDMDQGLPSFDLSSSRPSSRHSSGSQHQPTLSEAILGLPSDDPPLDDELPDYEQSQREAAEQSKLKSRGRAAELERRWASSMNQHVNR